MSNAERRNKDFSFSSERIRDQTEESFQYILNLVTKLEIPRTEIDARQLIIESECTHLLQRLVTFANINILRSFNLHLRMELPLGSNIDALGGDAR